MKRFLTLVMMLAAVSLFAGDKETIRDLPKLIAEIHKVTNNRWKITGGLSCISLESKAEFMGKWYDSSGSIFREFYKINYFLSISICDKIDPEQYQTLKKEYEENYKKLEKEATQKIKHVAMKGYYNFYPETKEQWDLLLKYELAKKKYEKIPDYYYKGVGVRYNPVVRYEVKDKKDKVFLQIESDVKKIMALLKKY